MSARAKAVPVAVRRERERCLRMVKHHISNIGTTCATERLANCVLMIRNDIESGAKIPGQARRGSPATRDLRRP